MSFSYHLAPLLSYLPLNLIGIFLAGLMYLQKPIEITVLNNIDEEIVNNLSLSFLPESIMVIINNSKQYDALSKYAFFAGKKFDSNATNVFVCKDFTCSLPLQNIDEIKKILE